VVDGVEYYEDPLLGDESTLLAVVPLRSGPTAFHTHEWELPEPGDATDIFPDWQVMLRSQYKNA
jgi:hypothetical protein